MTRTRYIWIMSIFVVLLMGVNVFYFFDRQDQPQAYNGTLDLRGWNGTGKQIIHLDGEWGFYPDQLITGADNLAEAHSPSLITVPGNWQEHMKKDLHDGALGYGTYKLHIMLDDNKEDLVGFRVPLIRTAHRLFVNNEEIGVNGVVSEQPESYTPQVKPYLAFKEVSQDSIDIYVQVANYDFTTSGGLIHSIQMGPMDLILREQQSIAAFEFAMIAVFVLLALFFVLMHIQMPRNGWVYLSLFFFCTAISVSDQGTRWLLWIWPNIPYRWVVNVYWLSIVGLTVWMFMFIYSQHEKLISLLFKRGVLSFSGLFVMFILIFPTSAVTRIISFWLIESILVYVYVIFVLIRNLRNGDEQAQYKFLAVCLFSAHALLNMSLQLGLTELNLLYFIQVVGFSGAFSFIFLNQFFSIYRKTKVLSLEMKRMDRFKNEFMTGISEQMITPLNAVISIVEARLHSDDSLTSDQIHDLRLVTSVGWTMRCLVDDLQDFSRLREEEIVLSLRPVDLFLVMDEVIERLSYLTFSDTIKFSNNIKRSIPLILADEQRLNQILTGLVHHALKITIDGSIIIEAYAKREIVEIRIKMYGSGTLVYEQSKLVQMLNQEMTAYKSIHSDGSIGLHLFKTLVELHQGSLSAKAELFREVSFLITLPIAVEVSSEIKDKILSENHSQRREIPGILSTRTSDNEHSRLRKLEWDEDMEPAEVVIIDNDALNLNVLLALLSLDRYRVTVIRDAREALRSLQQMKQVDLVIVDRTLQGLSGIEVCRSIREHYTLFELPILLLTSARYADHAITASQAGANDFLAKPVEASELRVRVRTLLQMKRSVGERIRMELAFLQAQIKPHFLFNTLNSIAALSKRQPEKMTYLLTEFGHYLRESFRFDNSEPLIPFERELKLVKSYLHIEKVRFEEWLNFEIEILTTTNFRIPPLTIQPLVENAVRHGIMRRAEGGHILIRVTGDERDIRIMVKDDGVGIPPEILGSLRNSLPTGGIGIQNIERRLKQMFGYGLVIHSEPQKGTEIHIRLPLEKVGFHESNSG